MKSDAKKITFNLPPGEEIIHLSKAFGI